MNKQNQNIMNTLQKALSTNALFSFTSGLLLLIYQPTISKLFHLNISLPFLIIGVALLFFSLTILLELFYQNKNRIYWIILQDIIWVIASLILLLTQPFGISFLGNLIIFIVASIVLTMAIWQYKALQLQNKE